MVVKQLIEDPENGYREVSLTFLVNRRQTPRHGYIPEIMSNNAIIFHFSGFTGSLQK